MIISLRWLKDYIDISLSPRELAERLTLSGTEVASVEVLGEAWEHVVVGQIAALARHPQADRLELATVDLGGESLTVVTGAPNLRVGQKVPFARVGARLIDGHTGQPFTLKPARIRGVASQGMVCSEKELGISQDHTTIMVLDPQAPVGMPLAQYLGDALLDLKVTPNRPDCLSLLGVAWEVAALTGKRVAWPPQDYPEAGPDIEGLAEVDIADPDLCPRYCASLVRGVRAGPSPRWMQDRLRAAGMRPINNIVDITNYVMLEYGQPLHAFDFDRLRGGRIIVRRARPGERLTSLDGVDRALAPDMLVIADAQGPVALAGVMGGQETQVTGATADVLLESANFNSIGIRRTSAALRLRSEASIRFDKGLSPELPLPALRRATSLLVEVAGGVAARGILDVYPDRAERPAIPLTPEQVRRVLGLELGLERIAQVLEGLGFSCRVEGPRLLATPPYWRSDIRLVEDVVEEVARIVGYDAIPTTIPSGQLPPYRPDPLLALKERVRDTLAACGLQEVITYSLTSQAQLEKTGALGPAPLKVANPMSPEQEYLRTTLRASLLSALASNQRHGEEGVQLFEVGRVYLPRDRDLPQERETLCAVLAGPREERSWLGEAGEVDFYQAKGVAEALLRRLGVEATLEPGEDALLVPGRSALIRAGGQSPSAGSGQALGVVGQVRPHIVARFDIALPAVFLLEMDLEALLAQAHPQARYLPLPRFPGVVRDLALVVEAAITHRQVEAIIASSPLVSQVALFDVYVGAPVPPGHKSLAYRVVYRALDRTLAEEEAAQDEARILRRLEREVGARLRGS